MDDKPQIILYQTVDGKTRVEVRFEHENVWLTQKLMAELFGTTKQNVSLHLQNIFKEQELSQDSVVKDFLTTATDGKKYNVKMYSLEAVVAVGYRVNSERGILFRQWATERLKEYMVKGFTMDDARDGLLYFLKFSDLFIFPNIIPFEITPIHSDIHTYR